MQSMCFKKCSKCGFKWPDRASFLTDTGLRMIGYQSNFDELMAGMFLFNHICKTTLAVSAEDFRDLYDGPIFVERLNGTEKCDGYCLHQDDLSPCPARCQCAYVREIIQVIRNWPKQNQL